MLVVVVLLCVFELVLEELLVLKVLETVALTRKLEGLNGGEKPSQ